MAGAPTLQLALTSDRPALEQARRAVHRFLEPHTLSEATLYDVELVLEEALMNVIRHAYGDRPGRRIGIEVQLSPASVFIDIDDDGIAFDPVAAQRPERPASIAEAQPGGLGLRLLDQRTAAMAYRRDGGTNRLRVTVARS